MNRVVSLLLGLNNFTILERKTLTANDRNLQYMNIKIDDEIDIEDYSLLIRYKQVDGKIFADVYSIEKNNDIQIPNSILEFPQTLTIEFCYISNKNDNRITIPRKLQLNVINTYDTIVEPDDVVIGPSVADIIKEIPKKTEEGKAEIEKSKDEAIEELKKCSDSNVEESKEQINSFTSQKQDQLDVYANVKKSQLDEYTTTKNMDIDSHTAEKKNELNTHEKAKEKELDNYVTTVNKPELDKYIRAKEGELDTHTGKKKSELDVYEKAKEGQLDSHTNTKKEELNQHTIQKQGQLDEYTVAKKGELDSHTIEKKSELNTHEKAKEKELDSYVTTVNKPELDRYINIKKEELNSHTKTKESEITQVTETKKQEIATHGASELDKFNQGAKQEADKQIGRVVAEGDVQVQRVKDESNGVIPRIEKLEDGARQDNLCSYSVGSVKDDDYYLIQTSAPYGEAIVLSTLIEGRGIVSKEFTESTTIKIGSYYYNGRIYEPRCLITTNRNIPNDYPVYVCEYEGKIAYVFKALYFSSITVSCLDMESNSPSVCAVPKGEWIAKIIKKAELDEINIKTICEQTTVITDRSEILKKKSDLTGSTFTGLVAVKKDTNGEAMVALNSAYGNGDIYSGGGDKGVGFKNRTSGKGLFLGDDGSVKLGATNLMTNAKEVITSINELKSEIDKLKQQIVEIQNK